MAGYAKDIRRACKSELMVMKQRSADAAVIQAARRWLHRGADKGPAVDLLVLARSVSPVLDKMVTMREELRQFWLNRSHTREQLAAELQAWCHRAEASGIAVLLEFPVQVEGGAGLNTSPAPYLSQQKEKSLCPPFIKKSSQAPLACS